MNFSKRRVNIVTEAVIDSEPPHCSPVVLNVETWLPHPVIGGEQAGASGHPGKGADQECSQVLGGIATIFLESELIPAVGVVALDFAGLSPD